MPKRTFWTTVGMGLGFGSSYWVNRRVRRAVARYAPENLQEELAQSARGLGRTVRDAVAEGRLAMAEREAELRGDVGGAESADLVEPAFSDRPVDPLPTSWHAAPRSSRPVSGSSSATTQPAGIAEGRAE